jgi:hypothetical protein
MTRSGFGEIKFSRCLLCFPDLEYDVACIMQKRSRTSIWKVWAKAEPWQRRNLVFSGLIIFWAGALYVRTIFLLQCTCVLYLLSFLYMEYLELIANPNRAVFLFRSWTWPTWNLIPTLRSSSNWRKSRSQHQQGPLLFLSSTRESWQRCAQRMESGEQSHGYCFKTAFTRTNCSAVWHQALK